MRMRSISLTALVPLFAAALLVVGGATANATGSSTNTIQQSVATQGTTTPATEVPQAGSTIDQIRASCPMVTNGATIGVSNTENGVAMTFTTKTGNVDDLRSRVQHMANTYAMLGGQRDMMWEQMGNGDGMMGQGMMGQGNSSNGMMGQGNTAGGMTGKGNTAGGTMGQGMMSGSGMGMGSSMMPAANATVENVPGGARMVLTPVDSSQLKPLRVDAQAQMARMLTGQCPMLPSDQG